MQLDFARLRRGQWVIAGGAVALGIATFLFKWFGGTATGSVPGGPTVTIVSSANAWHSLSDTRWLLLVTILAALALVLAAAGGRELPTRLHRPRVLAALAGVTAACVLYRIFDHPHASATFGSVSVTYGAQLGLYLGFLACLAVLYGRGRRSARRGRRVLAPCGIESRAVIDREEVLHVARLARLQLDDGEVESMARELSAVLDHIARIGELDLDGVAPTAHVVEVAGRLRPDEPLPCLPREVALASAPAVADEGFLVPSPQA